MVDEIAKKNQSRREFQIKRNSNHKNEDQVQPKKRIKIK